MTPFEPWYITHAWEIVLAVAAAAKVIVNLVPSEKPRQIFGIVDRIITAFVPDNLKTKEENGNNG